MIDYREALKARDVVPHSTWIRDGGSEMYVILSENDDGVQELIASLGCAGMFTNVVNEVEYATTHWIRVARIRIEGKTFAGVDLVYVPLFLGQIDKGIFKRIG